MKYLLTALLAFTFITTGCDKNATDSNNNGDINKHSTVNIKTATEYFSFANNSGSSDVSAAHDVVFYSIKESPAPGAPEISFPRFRAKNGLSIALIKNVTLEEITEIPSSTDFIVNYSTEGDDWFHMVNQTTVVPDDNVYIVNTADGKFPAFKITNYYDEQGNSGVFSIEWKYLAD